VIDNSRYAYERYLYQLVVYTYLSLIEVRREKRKWYVLWLAFQVLN